MVKRAYIAVNVHTREVVGVSAVSASSQKGLAQFLKEGFVIDRVTVEEARTFFMYGLPKDWVL